MTAPAAGLSFAGVERLVVLLGAGASYAAGETGGGTPLTPQLFDPDYSATLIRYPAVDTAAAEIRRATTNGAVALEQHLRTKYGGDDAPTHIRRTYAALPCYLQELLFIAGACVWPASHYDLLWRSALEHADEVIFVTLNYDTLLDERLASSEPLDQLDDYIQPGRQWSLIKLHGSVNWAYPTGGNHDLFHPPPDVPRAGPITIRPLDSWKDQEIRRLRGLRTDVRRNGADALSALLQEARSTAGEGSYYPALALPLGAEDTIVCPDNHRAHLEAKLNYDFNLLVIGYSALDRAVLQLFANAPGTIQSCLTVDRDLNSALAITKKLNTQLRLPTDATYIYSGDFQRFAADKLDPYLDEPHPTAPTIHIRSDPFTPGTWPGEIARIDIRV